MLPDTSSLNHLHLPASSLPGPKRDNYIICLRNIYCSAAVERPPDRADPLILWPIMSLRALREINTHLSCMVRVYHEPLPQSTSSTSLQHHETFVLHAIIVAVSR